MKYKTVQIITLATFFAAVTVTGAAQSQVGGQMDHSKMGDMKGGTHSLGDYFDAEVRRVDKTTGKVTLRHGELRQFNMPPMTMAFEVSDKAVLEIVKAGDKVKFKLMMENDRMIVTEMKPAG